MWRLLPEPISEPDARTAVDEFRSWLVGNALRELDLYFSLFLDRTGLLVRFSKLHGTRVRRDHTIKDISGDTNAAKKYKTVMEELGEVKPDASMLRSLSNARNCLSHNAGLVSGRYENYDRYLEIRWIGLEARLPDRETPVTLPPVIDKPVHVNKGERIEITVIERKKRFAPGEIIQLTPNDLQEICVYYTRLADQVIEKFAVDLAARGVLPKEMPPITRPSS
jgi:hypothetical protein